MLSKAVARVLNGGLAHASRAGIMFEDEGILSTVKGRIDDVGRMCAVGGLASGPGPGQDQSYRIQSCFTRQDLPMSSLGARGVPPPASVCKCWSIGLGVRGV